MAEFVVTSFYLFEHFSPEKLSQSRAELEAAGAANGLKGLVIMAAEGFNGTVSGPAAGISAFKQTLESMFGAEKNFRFKDSRAGIDPFDKLKIKIKQETVTSGTPEIVPSGESPDHLSPAEWDQVLASGEDVLLIDVRNDYEYALGHFRGALDPQTRHFTEFLAWVDELEVPKDKKVLMYCTGGIRCEKAAIQMRERGFENVFQLDGGILTYLEQFPDRQFEGECFVFDHRVAVGQRLEPTKRWSFCPHCGNPGDQWIDCVHCNKRARICQCCAKEPALNTCSHNCSHHQRRLLGKTAHAAMPVTELGENQ